jgi:formate C-acetyltransferase
MTHFFKGSRSYLLASATEVPLPKGFWREPLPVRVATFFGAVVREHLPIRILEGELIVGAHFCAAMSRCLDKAEAKHRDAEEAAFLVKWHRLNDAGVGNCGAVPGHLLPNYARVLCEGWKALHREAKEVAARWWLPWSRREQARAITICAEAARDYSLRYAALARELAEAEADPARRNELLEIARICAKVPWEPADTFAEALQSLWTTHSLVMVAESYPGPGISPGRVDQYLLPFYRADVEAGRMTREHAKELLECLWIKHNYAYDYQGWAGTNQGINASFGQLVTLGGIDARGHDASNELTYLMLDVIEDMNLLEPKPNVRLHAKTPDALLDRLVEMLAKAQGAPFLLNFDENSMAGLRWQGLPEGKLWDYAPVGCLENTLVGCDRSGTVDLNLNLAKAVELALNDGRDLATGAQLGPKTGDPLTFRSFEELFGAFRAQLVSLVCQLIDANDLADAGRARYEPVPYLSALVDGCLDSGKDANAGGARYNFLTVEGIALATAADGLTAIRKLVFDDGRIGLDRVLSALRANFEGHEVVRQILRNKAPKCGNDDAYADEIAHRVSRVWTEEVVRHVSPSGKRYRGGYLSWNYWVTYAPLTAATPDGRRRGQYLSNAVCPVNGTDRKGPTAVIKSVGALGLETAPNGASHTMSFHPGLLHTAEGRAKLKALLRAYGRVGGTALQVNCIDGDTLRLAQQNPDEYGNLLVRVTGYNAYFVGLGKEIQDELIARESHRL